MDPREEMVSSYLAVRTHENTEMGKMNLAVVESALWYDSTANNIIPHFIAAFW